MRRSKRLSILTLLVAGFSFNAKAEPNKSLAYFDKAGYLDHNLFDRATVRALAEIGSGGRLSPTEFYCGNDANSLRLDARRLNYDSGKGNDLTFDQQIEIRAKTAACETEIRNIVTELQKQRGATGRRSIDVSLFDLRLHLVKEEIVPDFSGKDGVRYFICGLPGSIWNIVEGQRPEGLAFEYPTLEIGKFYFSVAGWPHDLPEDPRCDSYAESLSWSPTKGSNLSSTRGFYMFFSNIDNGIKFRPILKELNMTASLQCSVSSTDLTTRRPICSVSDIEILTSSGEVFLKAKSQEGKWEASAPIYEKYR